MIPGRVFRWVAAAALVSCGQRERLIFPVEDPGDGDGPITEIARPGVADTTVTEGDLLLIEGRAYDADGVDTVYIEVGGANQGFSPIRGEGRDTVEFALQLSTLNLFGATVVVRAHAGDLLGEQGGFVSRQIRIE
jgi:hypothetical protein